MKIKKVILSVICLLSLMLVLSSCVGMGRQTYDVTFNSNGGSTVETQNVAHDKTATRPADPTKEGHTFVDWFSDEALVTVYDFSSRVRKSFTLYAKWNVNAYKLEYETNLEEYSIKGTTANYGSSIKAPEVDEELFVLDGHTFAGWYLDAEFNTQLTEETKMPAKDVTLYAKWSKDDHKVIFIVDDLTYKVENVKFGDSIPSVDNPTKEGHTFAGWLLSKADNSPVSNDYKISKDITLYAKWNINQYTITFDSNGGSTVEAATYNFNASLTVPQAPTKEGHTFAGWYNGETYFNFNDNRMPANNITLVAKWNVNSYNVDFDSNGGSDVTDTKVEFGAKVTKPTDPTRTGYTFAGWLLNDVAYDFNSSMPASNIKLVAKWTANQYTISFNSNGGTGSLAAIDATYDVAVSAPENTFERIGYTFVKWNTKADGTGTSYVEGISLKNISTNEDVTLYAIWSQNEYKLTVSLSQTQSFTHKLHYGDSIEEIFAAIDTTKEGAEFAGWYAFINNDWVKFNTEDATMPNSDLTVGAKYLGEVTITFVSNGNPVGSLTGYESETIEDSVPTTTRTGYTFVGWFLDEALTQPYNLTVYPNVDTNVYAKWNVNTVVIKFNGNGSTAGSMNNQSIVYDSNTALNTNTFEKTGHTFLGWATSSDADEVEFVDGYNKNVISEGEVTLYAVWKVNTYSITFNSNEGSAVAKIEKNYGEVVNAPTDPTRDSYTFAGWLLNNEAYSFSTMPAENITLVANWTPNKHTLTIYITGEEKVESDIYFDALVLNYDAISKPNREGYKFNGWYSDASLSVKVDFDQVSKVEGNMELYGSYTKETYTVRFISNGEILYSVEKAYGDPVEFNEYINQVKVYAEAFDALQSAISETVNDSNPVNLFTLLLGENKDLYLSQEGLAPYITKMLTAFEAKYIETLTAGGSESDAQMAGVLAGTGTMSQDDWFAFYGVAKGLSDGANALFNMYDKNKMVDENGKITYIPNHAGHFFGGWVLGADTTLNGKVTGAPFTENITPASTVGSNIVNIVAKWEKLNGVKDLSAKENSINTIIWTQIKTDQFDLEVGETLEITYLIYSVGENNDLTLLDTVNHINGEVKNEYQFMTKDTYKAPGLYNLVIIPRAQIFNSENEVTRTYDSDINESTVLEEYKVVVDPDNVEIDTNGDYYSVSGSTFYLFTNMDYNFTNGDFDFELVNPNDSIYATLNENKISTKDLTGQFKFTNTTDNNGQTITKEYTAIVLPYVSQFTLGTGLSNFLNSNEENSAFYGKNATYTIGRQFADETLTSLYEQGIFDYKDNGYKFDLNITTNNGMEINPTGLNSIVGKYLNYKFYDSSNNEVEIGEHDEEKDSWSFTALPGDYSVEISINPLYVAPIDYYDANKNPYGDIKPLKFNFTIDNSVNVYTHEQFKAVYNNTNIGKDSLYADGKVTRGISMHANIEARIEDNQYYDYWKNNPEANPSLDPNIDGELNLSEALKTHSPINIDNGDVLDVFWKDNYTNGNVYERVSNVELNETYNINGNCFTIDGTNLPFVSVHSRGNQSTVSGYYIPRTSCAIIKYIVCDANKVSNSKLVLNDLMIVGNSTKPVLDESSENFLSSIQLMNKNAGGYQAVNLGYGSTVDTNNVYINKTVIAININVGCSANIVDSKFVDCWFNGIYGYGNKDLTITNSYMKDFGGAVIHLEDIHSKVEVDAAGNEINEIPAPANVTIDTNSVLENYVSGDEGYFKSYSLEILIMQLKSQFESNISSNDWTMIKNDTDPVTGLSYSKVNLIMLLVSRGDNAEKEDFGDGTKGAGRNMMNLGFDAAHTPLQLYNVNNLLSALGQQTLGNYINTSILMGKYNENIPSEDVLSSMGINRDDLLFKGNDIVALQGDPFDPINTQFKGMLITYQPELPGFGGSIILTGVKGQGVE